MQNREIKPGTAFCPGDPVTSNADIETELMRLANQFSSIKEIDLSGVIAGDVVVLQVHRSWHLLIVGESWNTGIPVLSGGSGLELDP